VEGSQDGYSCTHRNPERSENIFQFPMAFSTFLLFGMSFVEWEDIFLSKAQFFCLYICYPNLIQIESQLAYMVCKDHSKQMALDICFVFLS
jgi:hypothetical protein